MPGCADGFAVLHGSIHLVRRAGPLYFSSSKLKLSFGISALKSSVALEDIIL
jgi:hypothetical protein